MGLMCFLHRRLLRSRIADLADSFDIDARHAAAWPQRKERWLEAIAVAKAELRALETPPRRFVLRPLPDRLRFEVPAIARFKSTRVKPEVNSTLIHLVRDGYGEGRG